MYRTKAIYQLSDLKQSSLKILRLFKIYRQSGSQAPVALAMTYVTFSKACFDCLPQIKLFDSLFALVPN